MGRFRLRLHMDGDLRARLHGADGVLQPVADLVRLAHRHRRRRDEMEVDDRYEAEARGVPGGRGGKRSHSAEEGDAGRSGSGKGDGLPDERMDEA